MTSSMFIQGYIQQFTLSCDKMMVYSTTSIVQVFATAILALVLIPLKGLEGYLMSLVLANLIGALYSFNHFVTLELQILIKHICFSC